MIIESIRIVSFGCLRDYETSFDGRLNIIEGENESGKSTLAAFIKYMLYGFGRKNSEQAVSERKKYINWDTGRAEGSMILCVAGKHYRIDRLTKLDEESDGVVSFSESLSVVDLEERRRLDPQLIPGEVFLGVPSEVFSNTAFVGQANTGLSERAMNGAIENLIFSGDERLNIARAAEAVAAERDEILSPDGSGLLADARRRRDEIKKKHAAAEKLNAEIIDREAALSTAQKNLMISVNEYNETVELNEACKKNALLERYEQMHEQEARSRELTDKINELRRRSAFNSFCPSDSYSNDIKVARDTFLSALSDSTAAQAKYEQMAAIDPLGAEEKRLLEICERQSDDGHLIREHHRAMLNRTVFFSVSAVFFALFAAIAVFGYVSLTPLVADLKTVIVGCLLVVMLGGSIATLTTALGYRKLIGSIRGEFGVSSRAEMDIVIEMISGAKQKKSAHESFLREASDALIYSRGRLDSARAELGRVLGMWGRSIPANDAEVSAAVDIVMTDVEEFVDAEGRLKMLRATCDGKAREIKYSLAGTDESALRAELPDSLRESLKGFDYSDLERKIEFWRKRGESLDMRMRQISATLSQLRIASEDSTELGDRLRIAETEIEALEARYNALSIAHEAIVRSEERLRAEISPRLESYSREIINTATDGKYDSVGVGEGLEMSFGTKSPSRHIDYYSSGTRDIAYVSLRMALIDLLYREAPPVCFDEVFSHQDERRAGDFMRAIVSLSEEGRQFFVFTCRAREASIAASVCTECGRIKLG